MEITIAAKNLNAHGDGVGAPANLGRSHDYERIEETGTSYDALLSGLANCQLNEISEKTLGLFALLGTLELTDLAEAAKGLDKSTPEGHAALCKIVSETDLI